MGAADEVVSDYSGDVLFWGFHVVAHKNGYSPILDTSVRACRGGDSRGLFADLKVSLYAVIGSKIRVMNNPAAPVFNAYQPLSTHSLGSAVARSNHLTGPFLITSESGCPHRIAVGISSLFHKLYGEQYHRSVTKTPQSVQRSIEEGSWIACVYTRPTGEVVAHGALLRIQESWRLARVLVDESARGLGLGEDLTETLLSHADSLSDDGTSPIVTESVTAHHGTQRIFAKAGFRPLGLLVSKFNDYFNTGYRESAVLMGRAITTSAEAVFVPSAIAPVVSEIFQWHGIATQVRTGRDRCGTALSSQKSSGVSFALDDHMSIARLALAAGSDLSDLDGLVNKAQAADAAYIELKIEVSTPDGYALAQKALAQQFTFAGVEPHRDGVWLILQQGTNIAQRVGALTFASTEAKYIQSIIAN